MFDGLERVAIHTRHFGRHERVVVPEHFEAVFAHKPRARIMVYRDWLVGLSATAAEYVSQLCRKRYAEMDAQMTALYDLAQRVGRDEFLAALELAAEQQTFGAEYVSALIALPRPRPLVQGSAAELQARWPNLPSQRAIERDLAQYEQYVANREAPSGEMAGGAT